MCYYLGDDQSWLQQSEELWVTFFKIFTFHFLLHTFYKTLWNFFCSWKFWFFFFPPQELHSSHGKTEDWCQFWLSFSGLPRASHVTYLGLSLFGFKHEETKLWFFCITKNQIKVKNVLIFYLKEPRDFIIIFLVYLYKTLPSLVNSFVLSSCYIVHTIYF